VQQEVAVRSQEPAPAVEERVVFTDAELTRADFAGRRMRYFTAISSRFTACDFRGMQISHGGSLGGGGQYSEYVDCVFDQVKLTGVKPGRATFVRCSFRGVRIRKMFSHDAEFIDCVFTGKLEHVVFSGRPASYEGMVPNPKPLLEFRGNDFSGAVLEDVGFRSGVELGRQSLPAGEEYLLVLDADLVLSRAREIAEARPATDPSRDSVRAAIAVGLDEVADGQKDYFRSLVKSKDTAAGHALRAVIAQAQAEINR
jgi:uncharacterized protein YjbI with pentapeptide repeats